MEIVPVALLTDNYAYLVHDGQTTVAIDPSSAAPVVAELDHRGWKLNAILNTHHHWDHVGGNPDLQSKYRCEGIGPRGDASRIVGVDREMSGGEKLVIGSLSFDVLFIPGHTRHHVALWLPEAKAVFTGDTLFLMGCGRMFEGTPAQMWASLELLAGLPGDTRVYCGHEYTVANARFALSLDPDDEAFRQAAMDAEEKRKAGWPTIPGLIATEKAANPFLRLADAGFRNKLYPGQSAVEAFASLRSRKDAY